jgi:hypothetical protein
VDRDAYRIGAEILDRTNIRARRLLFYTRLLFLILLLMIVFLVWYWGCQLFGESIGFGLAVCAAVEPNLAGHGVLINSDVPAAFAALWFAYAAWRYWCRPDAQRLFVLSLAVTFAVLTKFSLLPLFGAGLVLALWRGPRLLAALVLPLVVYLGMLAASQFQAQPVPPAEVAQFSGAGVPDWALGGIRLLARLPWPLQFVRGILFIGGTLRGDGFNRIHVRPADPRPRPALFSAGLGCQVSNPSADSHAGRFERPSGANPAAGSRRCRLRDLARGGILLRVGSALEFPHRFPARAARSLPPSWEAASRWSDGTAIAPHGSRLPSPSFGLLPLR